MLSTLSNFLFAHHTPSVESPPTSSLHEDLQYHPPDFNIDNLRPITVRCIGAGFSGIVSSLRLRQYIPNLDLKVYEKQDGVGGTWRVNRYPGLACDVPSHCYQFSFEDNPQWSRFYPHGSEVRASIERTVNKYKLRDVIHLRHELMYARWDDAAGKWTIRVRRSVPASGGGLKQEEFEETCDVLLLCIGTLNRWRWPDIEGLKEFKGKIAHTADYHLSDEDIQGKSVGVVGNGSSGIQTVSAVHPKAGSLVNYARQKTWIAPDFSINEMKAELGRKTDDPNIYFTQEELERLKDPQYAKQFRHNIEHAINTFHSLTIRDSELQKQGRAMFEADMKRRLAKKPELVDHIVPDWSVFCRRLTPGDGYLEALCADNTTYETTPIKRITPTGVELTDGRHMTHDVLILATGFDVSYQYPFPVLGRDGKELNARWKTLPETYMSMAVDGFPNMFFLYGPSSGLNTSSNISVIENQAKYMTKCVAKLQRERLKAMEPKADAVKDWMQHMQHYFPKTVYMDKCKSWYSAKDGTIVGLWPGSTLHVITALAHPRWEDFEYSRLDSTPNRLFWLGDGQTVNEATGSGDLAWYLDNVDVPPIPE